MNREGLHVAASATTSSTRAGASCSGCSGAAASTTGTARTARTPARRPGVRRRRVPVPRRQRESTTRAPARPSSRPPRSGGRRCAGRLHRDDARGHAEHRQPGRHPGPEVQRRGETANKVVPKLQKRGVKSIVVLLHEGVPPPDAPPTTAAPGLSGPALDIAQQPQPADRRRRHRPHAPALQLRREGPGRASRAAHQRASVRPDGHQAAPAHRPGRTGDIVRPAAFAENLIVENDAAVDAGADRCST